MNFSQTMCDMRTNILLFAWVLLYIQTSCNGQTVTSVTTTTTNASTSSSPTTTPNTNSSECLTQNGNKCIFPFYYMEKLYSSCSKLDNDGLAWCATSTYSTKYVKLYENCSLSCETDVTIEPSECSTLNGVPCIFPFKYGIQAYNNCIDVGSTKFWCAVSLYPDTHVHGYGFCNSACDRTTSVKTGCRTTDGFKCIFPFKYYGKTYNNCTNVDNGSIDWCATSLDINENVMGWGNCGDNC
ncbi:72 kDa type IV collagenase isoform X1 [Lepeophtheirus salmonis]|uniref:72 kDa type IV collagenase isoform X1 n=1 Tax=Lepeophtheirus salmonis TaxID=72036 RepID=UPI001AE1CEE1|nr:matrix metalloproteinase-9-like isoform X1 [Lepeophtheirus salmonis]